MKSQRGPLADLLQMAFFALLVRPFLAVIIGLKIRGREQLPLPSQGRFLLIANHTSHLDTVSLLALFPLGELKHIRPVAAADYFERNRFVSVLSRTLFNTLPIARKREERAAGSDPREAMLAALRAGDSLLLFPEGTRRVSDDHIGQFRRGVASLVEGEPGLRVVPAWLVNMGRSLPKGEWIPVPFFCEIHLGAPLSPRGSSEEILSGLASAIEGLRDEALASRSRAS